MSRLPSYQRTCFGSLFFSASMFSCLEVIEWREVTQIGMHGKSTWPLELEVLCH